MPAPGVLTAIDCATGSSAWRRSGIYIGGSSWKYEGWLPDLFAPALYQSRGKFSKKLFEATCLERVRHRFSGSLRGLCLLSVPFARTMGEIVPATTAANVSFWGFKVPEQITVASWPVHPRYGALAGLENPTFLDAALFEQAFLRALEPYPRTGWRADFRVRNFRSDAPLPCAGVH